MAKPSSKRKGPSQRQLKVGEEIRHALSNIFFREDFYLQGEQDVVRLTVAEVRVSADLRNATVFVMPLAGKAKEKVIQLLSDKAGYIRKLLASNVEMRFMPQLTFRLDTTFETAHHLDTLFNTPKVRADITKAE